MRSRIEDRTPIRSRPVAVWPAGTAQDLVRFAIGRKRAWPVQLSCCGAISADPSVTRQWRAERAHRDSFTPFHRMKHAMLRRELTLRLTAACVVLAAALSQLTLARAEPQGGPAGAASDETAKAATTKAEPSGP